MERCIEREVEDMNGSKKEERGRGNRERISEVRKVG